MTIRVLVLDDEKQWREILEEVLQSEGYEVEISDNFAQAKRLLTNNHYHLAVLDIVLSGDVIVEGAPSGLDLLLEIHQLNVNFSRHCGVVIVTGNAAIGEIHRALKGNLPSARDLYPAIVLKRGRDGKGFSIKEFLEACQQVMRTVISD